jgi:hypothetical protein
VAVKKLQPNLFEDYCDNNQKMQTLAQQTSQKSAPVFQWQIPYPKKIFGIIRNHRPLITKACGGNEYIGDAHRCALIEQLRVDLSGHAGTVGIKGKDLQHRNKSFHFFALFGTMNKRGTISALKKLELRNHGNVAFLWQAISQAIHDIFATTKYVNADVCIENAFHSTFS